MGESFKAVCVLIVMIAIPVAVLSWTVVDRPDQITWLVRLSSLAVGVGAIVALLLAHFRVDKEHDYLFDHVGNYFNRGGFCFGFQVSADKGTCYLQAYFQNQRSAPCLGRIALRPAKGFFGRAKIEGITIDVTCESGAFGVAQIPLSLPEKSQGTKQSFEVGAHVEYPNGKGERIRYRDGIFLRRNAEFSDAFATTLTVAGALTGHIVLHRPATVKIVLPSGVAENAPEDAKPLVRTLWKLGDPPLTRPTMG